MDPVFLNYWEESKIDGLKADFGIGDAELEGASIILASYLYEEYNGSAYVLFERDGKLWLVEGGHCSCYGLSESGYSGQSSTTQWQPEETTVESLRNIIASGGDPFVGGKEVVEAYLANAAQDRTDGKVGHWEEVL